jgi:Flp pilus assembly pilin Flp
MDESSREGWWRSQRARIRLAMRVFPSIEALRNRLSENVFRTNDQSSKWKGNRMLELYTKLQARLAQEDGQTMAEYAVVLAVIAIGIFIALGALSGAIGGALDKVTADI